MEKKRWLLARRILKDSSRSRVNPGPGRGILKLERTISPFGGCLPACLLVASQVSKMHRCHVRQVEFPFLFSFLN